MQCHPRLATARIAPVQIVREAGSVDEKRWASTIWPIRQNGNLLLCTLLLGNVAVNAQLSILTAALTSGLLGFLVSTALIVIFGEIIPQALCSRYALYIGAKTVPLVRVIMLLLYIVAKPISMALDWALGEELGKFYNESEFNSLIEQHAAIISPPRRLIMQGALAITTKTVADIMTKRDAIFSVRSSDKLTFEVMSRIFKSGFSRVPVFDDAGESVVGMLFAKDLMLVVPADEVPVITVVSFFERDEVLTVDATTVVEECLSALTTNGTHLAMVRDIDDTESDKDPTYSLVGLVTLEDVIEQILQMELVDEFDEFETSAGDRRTKRAAFGSETLRLLDTSRGHNDLEPALVRAVAATLQATVPAFQALTPAGVPMSFEAIQDLVSGSRVLDLVAPEASPTGADKPDDEGTPTAPGSDLYVRGNVYTVCTMVLNGEFEVTSGSDGIKSVKRSFELLASKALTAAPGTYVADFSARLRSGTARVLRIARDEYADALLFARPGAAPGAAAAAPDAGAAAAPGRPKSDSVVSEASASARRDTPETQAQGAARVLESADQRRLHSRPGLAGTSLTPRDPQPPRHRRRSKEADTDAVAVTVEQ